MLFAYIDESGTHDRAKAVMVGGLVGHVGAWAKFSKSWDKILRKAGASCYHAADVESCHGEYAAWDQAKKISFQKAMIREVRRVASYGVSCGVSIADFKAVVPEGEDHGSPYMACVAGAVMKAVGWAADQAYQHPIPFVFESGGPEPGVVAEYFNFARKHKPLVGPLTFADKSVLPLHAADFYAYEAWKFAENCVVDGKKRDIRKTLQGMIDLPHMDSWMFERDGLEDLVERERKRKAEQQGTA